MTPEQLLQLYKTVTQHFKPATENIGALSSYLQHTPEIALSEIAPTALQRQRVELTRQGIRDMARSSRGINLSGDDGSRLLVLPTGKDLKAAGASMNFTPGSGEYVDRPNPGRGGVYVNTLGSRVPLGGLSMLQQLRDEQRGLNIGLHSLPEDNTMNFYERLGMELTPDSESSLPYYTLHRDSPILGGYYDLPDKYKRGGVVQYA